MIVSQTEAKCTANVDEMSQGVGEDNTAQEQVAVALFDLEVKPERAARQLELKAGEKLRVLQDGKWTSIQETCLVMHIACLAMRTDDCF